MKKIWAVLGAVLLMGMAGSVLAHGGAAGGTGVSSGTVGTVSTGHGKSGHSMSPKSRLIRQHRRIERGVKKGTLSKPQAHKLRQEGKEINQERKGDLQKDGGKLTSQDHKTLEEQLNERSNEIKTDKDPSGTTGY